MDKLIEKALFKKEEIKNRGKTKGRFHFEASTNAGKWMIDKKWTCKQILMLILWKMREKNKK